VGLRRLQLPSRKLDRQFQEKSPSFTLPPGFRKSSFCSSWLTGDWWGRKPEELQLYFSDSEGIPLLAFSKANRRPCGMTSNGKKPYKLQQSTKPFFYDISEKSHLEAFLRTLRHLVAFSAGLNSSLGKKPYTLEANEVKKLCQTEISTIGIYDPTKADREADKALEILEVRCSYIYDKNVEGDFITPWSKEYEKPAPTGRKQFSCNKKVYHFRIKRVLIDTDGRRRNAAFISKSTYIDIPHTAVEKLSSLAPSLVQAISEHGTKDKNRYRHFESTFTPPRIAHTFNYRQEDLLFLNPKAYRYTKLKKSLKTASFNPLTISNRYYNRLRWLQTGILSWDPTWSINETTAKNDLVYLNNWFIKVRLIVLYATCLVLTFLKRLFLKRVRVLPKNIEVILVSQEVKFGKSSWKVYYPRGPPFQNLNHQKIKTQTV